MGSATGPQTPGDKLKDNLNRLEMTTFPANERIIRLGNLHRLVHVGGDYERDRVQPVGPGPPDPLGAARQ